MTEIAPAEGEMHSIFTDFTVKKFRNYSPQLEESVLQFINEASRTFSTKSLRDVLAQYKITCQNTSVDSIQRVFEHTITSCQQITSFLPTAHLSQIEDLDIPFTDCSIEGYKNLRFTWEIFKSMLDILKNNNKFEDIFLKVIRATFDFCVMFDRKTEFKRLCDFLHGSLNSMMKSSHGAFGNVKMSYFSINLSVSESSTMQVELRLSQLNSAILLKCWNEAFRILEDLQVLLQITKKSLSPTMLLDYFRMVFSVLVESPDSNYQILSCSTLLKCLGIVTINGLWDTDSEKLSLLCDRILLSFMSIPLFVSSEKLCEDERFVRIASFIGVHSVPSCSSLRNDIFNIKGNVIFSKANPTLIKFFKDFVDFTLSSELKTFISDSKYSQFLSHIESNLNIIQLRNIVISKEAKIFSISSLLPLFSSFSSELLFEKFLVVNSWKLFNIRVSIDHQSGTVSFANNFSIFLLSNCLMNPTEPVVSASKKPLIIKNKDIHAEEVEDLLSRCKLIEEKKEKREQLELAKEQEQYRLLSERLAKEQEQEKARLAEESRKREVDRLKKEREAVEKEELKKVIDEFVKKCQNSGKTFNVTINDCKTRQDFIQKQLAFLNADKIALDKKMAMLFKQTNYTSRAIRAEEIPILKELSCSMTNQRRKEFERMIQSMISASKMKYDQRTERKGKILNSIAQFSSFKNEILSKRKEEYEKLLAENQAAFEIEKQKRIDEAQKKTEEEELARQAQKNAVTSLREDSFSSSSNFADKGSAVVQTPFLHLEMTTKPHPTQNSTQSPIISERPSVQSPFASNNGGRFRGSRYGPDMVISRSTTDSKVIGSAESPSATSEIPQQSPKPGKYDPAQAAQRFASKKLSIENASKLDDKKSSTNEAPTSVNGSSKASNVYVPPSMRK